MVPEKLSDSIEPEPSLSIWMVYLHMLTSLIIQGALIRRGREQISVESNSIH